MTACCDSGRACGDVQHSLIVRAWHPACLQVHEKGVLFPSLAVCLLPPALAKEWRQWGPLRSSAGIPWILAVHFQLVSLFSMCLGFSMFY